MNTHTGESQETRTSGDDAVQTAHTRWWESLLASDEETLEELLADDLTFHSPYGTVSNKGGVLDSLRSGRLSYDSIEDQKPLIRSHGDVGIVTGSADIHFQWEGQPIPERLYYTAVYGRDSSGWRMLAWHSTQRADAPD